MPTFSGRADMMIGSCVGFKGVRGLANDVLVKVVGSYGMFRKQRTSGVG